MGGDKRIAMLNQANILLILRREDQLPSGPHRRHRGRNRALNAAERAIERKLAYEFMLRQFRLGKLFRSDENGESHRQIVTSALFRQVGGRQIDGDALCRKAEAAVNNGATHPFARLFHRGFRQTDQRQRGQAAADMRFYDDQRRFYAYRCSGKNSGQCHNRSLTRRLWRDRKATARARNPSFGRVRSKAARDSPENIFSGAA